MKEIKVVDSYKNQLHTYIFDGCTEIKGVVQLLHGINENGLKYVEFAKFLNKNGYVVYIHDHVSQGKTRTKDDRDVVYFGKNGHIVLVDGLNMIRKQIEKEYPRKDIYLFGHSLGSMITRSYLINYQNVYKKIILSGGGYADTKGLNIGICLGCFLKLLGKRKPSNIFDNMFRKTQLKLNEKVKIDHFIEWLTRDKDKTEENKVDPYLFIRVSISSFVDMLHLMKEINNKNNIKKMSLDVPILLLSGTHDPATDFGLGVTLLDDLLKEYGFNSQHILYKEGRHDSIQEVNRVEVFNDILTFIGA